MEQFWFLFCTMGLSNTMFFDGFNPNFDIIGELPYEVATSILRLLDGKTLLKAALVCRKWMRIIKSDRALRRKIREEFRARRMAGMFYRPGPQISDVSGTFSSTSNLNAGNVRRTKKTVGVEPRTGNSRSRKRKFESSVCVPQKKAKIAQADNNSLTSRTLQKLR